MLDFHISKIIKKVMIIFQLQK